MCCSVVIAVVFLIECVLSVQGSMPRPEFLLGFLILVPFVLFCGVGLWLVRKYTLGPQQQHVQLPSHA